MQAALKTAQQQGGGNYLCGERVTEGVPAGGFFYVKPADCFVYATNECARLFMKKRYAPIMYVLNVQQLPKKRFENSETKYQRFCLPAVFTESMRAELFLWAPAWILIVGIANVNIGTSRCRKLKGGAFRWRERYLGVSLNRRFRCMDETT